MPRAKITVTIPDRVWIGAFSSEHPDLIFRVISTQYGADTAIGLIEIRTENPVPVISGIDGQDDVVDLELLWTYDEEALLQVETADPQLLVPVWRAGVPLKTPFTISDGTASWEISTSRSKLSALGDQLDSIGMSYEIESIRNFHEDRADDLMTDRQLEVLLAAFDAGYYDTPRRATLTQVAESLDVTKATCSDVLHRAEEKIIEWFVAEHVTNAARRDGTEQYLPSQR